MNTITPLATCSQCEGFLPPQATACPHCGEHRARLNSAIKNLFTVASGGLVAITLMACYGAAPTGYHPVEPVPPTTDQDADGFSTAGEPGRVDCDDMVASIHPGADDPGGDGVDQNCDGVDGIASTGGSTTTNPETKP